MRKGIALAVALVLFACLNASAAVEAYGTFECMGVAADPPGGYTAAQIGQVRVYLDDGGTWKRQQDAVQVASEERFASSIFNLTPGTSYDVRVEFYDLSMALVDTQTASGSTRADVSIPAPASELYVSPGGSDSGAGTVGDPFATLAHALALATPGTTIYMRGGPYYDCEVTPTVSGTSGAPIVIRAYNGETPMLDGADSTLISTTWTLVQPEVYSHACTIDCRNVTLRRKSDGTVFRAFMMGTAAEVTSATSDGYTFAQLYIDAAYSADGADITIRVPTGTTIADYDVFVAKCNTAITLDTVNFVYVDGLTITHYGAGDYNRGIFVRSADDVVIQNCRFLYNNTGIWVKNDSDRLVVQDNACVDDTADWHFTYTKSLGVLYHGEIETGLVVMDGTYGGRGLVIRRNDIRGTFDGSGIAPSTAYTGASTAETDFYGNRITHVCDDFCEIDGYARNVRFFGNYMRGSLSGISLAQALDGPTWIVRNLILDCGTSTASTNPDDYAYEGYPFKTNGGPHPEIGSGQVFFYHNTAYSSDPAGRAMLVKSSVLWKKFTFRNNIWCGQAMGFDKWSGALSPMDWDYDDLYHAAGDCMVIDSTVYNTLADAQAGTGYLANGISSNPNFINAVGGDYHVSAAGPCVDAGVAVFGINDDYSGAAPDMGAYETNGTGNVYWVATTGDDANDGSESHPWRTVQHAVDTTVAGDTIIVKPGTYVGCHVNNSGTALAPKTLMSETRWGALLNAAPAGTLHGSVFEIEGDSYWVIDGFEVDGLAKTLRCVDIRDADHVTVKNCHVHDAIHTGIFDGFHEYAVYENNVTHDNGEHGIYHSNSSDYAVIRGNTSYTNTSCGIHMNGDISMGGDGVISFCTIENNTCYDNPSGSAINMDGVSDSVIRNNLLYNNRGSGISVYAIDASEGSSRDRILNNTIVMPDNGRWALNIPDWGIVAAPSDNKAFNNIIYNARADRGSITTFASPVGFESDYNVMVDRFTIDDDVTILTLAQWKALGYDAHSFLATPADLFVDPAGNDYHLKAGSPAIDAGTALVDVTSDIEGRSRPSGIAYDIGAYEYDQSSAGDSDGDGLPDAWEIQYFGNLSQGPGGDPDGDGYSNLTEYHNGTDPTSGETLPPYMTTIQWTPVGPGGGGAQYNPGIAPNNPNLMYGFCDMGGIYRSTNGGHDWNMYRADEAQFPVAYSPTHCNPAFHPTNGDICFIGVWGGLKRTTDGGDTWQWVHQVASPTAIAIDRADATVMFYATNANRMYKSIDSGSTWAEVPAWYSSVNQTVLDIFVDASTPTSNLTIYAATATGMYKSTNGGTTWATANGDLPSTSISDFNAAMQGGSTVLYVTLTTPGVYESTNGGVNWVSKSNGIDLGPAGHMELGICDGDPTVLYVGTQENGGPTIYKTTDGGDNWTMVLTDPSAGNFPVGVTVERDWMTLTLGWAWGEEAHEIGVCGTDPNYVAFAEDGRTWASHDGGQSWFCCNSRETSLNSNWWPSRGFEVTTNYSVKFAPWDHDRAYINYTDMGFFRSEDHAYSWRHAISGSPYRNTFYDCAFDPTIAGKMWAVASNNHDMPHDKMLRQGSFLTFTGAVLKSDDYGVTWSTVVYPRGVNGGCTTSLAIDPTSPAGNRTLYVTVSGHGVYKSTDDGATWTSASVGLTMPNNNNSWLIKRMSDGTLYCALTASYVSGTRYPGGLFKSADGAATWTQLNASQVLPYIYGFDVDPTNQNIIYVATHQLSYDGRQGIYRTTDGGANWTRAFDLGDMADASIDPQLHTRVYGALGQGEDFWSDGGLYLSEDSGGTWTKLSTFPFERYGPSWISYDPDDSQIVYVTTFGGGVWKGTVLHATAPAAEFGWSPGPGVMQITFDPSASTGTINTHHWQFGDGFESFEANPVHTYATAGTYSVTLSVEGPAGTSAISHDVTASETLVITTAALPGGAIGAAYSDTLAAVGGIAPYTWAVTVGVLPDGLSLNAATGEISGTPTADGTFDFTVEATDSTSGTPQTATKDLQIIIAPSNPTITTATLPDGTDGQAYSQALSATGGVLPYTWSITAGALPNGLSLNAATGVISGTAYRSGTFNFTAQVADSQLPAATDTQALSIVIAAADSDGDGLPDGWEMQYFGNLAQGPNDDPDGDGWTNIQEYNAGSDPTVPDAAPPIGMLRPHPRLWMEAGSIDPVVIDEAAVISRTGLPAYSTIWTDVQGSSNVANQALTYLVNGNAGKLSSVKTALSTTTANAEQLIYRSLAFDWVYNGLTPAERASYAANLVTSANSIIDASLYLYGNYGIRYQAASAMAALAAAGDTDVSSIWPKAYDRMTTVLEVTGDGIAPSDMEGRMAWGGGWNEGYDYNRHTQIHMLQYLQALRSAFGPHEDKLSTSEWAAGVVKFMIYGILPDGSYMLPFADNDWPFLLAHDRTIVLLATDAANDQHGQYWLNHVYATDGYWAYTDLLFYDAARPEQSFDTLPNGWYFPGIGLAVFRSGWGANDTYVAFKSSDYHTYHQNDGQNVFYIYKSAPLAVRTGVYDGEVHDHNVNYCIRTIAQNCITVFDPTEAFSHPDGIPDDNDGGQLVQEWTGEHHNFAEWRAQADRAGTPRNIVDWVDYELGAGYGYAAAEAGRAYEAGKVPFASRQLLWIDPDYVIVFDRAESGNANFQKKFHLHSPEGMTITGPDTAMMETTTAPGTTAPARLFTKMLMPAGASLGLVGGVGNEYFYNGRNHPGPATYNDQINGLWRLEESAPLTTMTYFLNVMYATDAGTASMPEAVIYQETADRVRVAINRGEYVVFFDKTGAVNWGFDALDALVITNSSLPAGTVGQAYSQALVVTGGLPTYAWAIASGTLPNGLALDGATGVISGTCASTGTFDFTVEVTDSAFAPSTTTKALQIVVATSNPTITTASLPGVAEGATYLQTLAATGGITPYRWYVVSGALPGGLTLNAASGAISGTAYTAGSYDFTVKVWDAQAPNAYDTQAFTIIVSSADSDADGLPDGWEIEHFGDLSHGPSGDDDGDGYLNITEYRNGTDPMQAGAVAPYLANITWTSVGPGGGGAQYNATPAPNNPDLMVGVCDMGGFYRSIDGGRHWTMVHGRDVNLIPSYRDTDCGPEFHPQNENLLLVARQIGFVLSTDGGLTYTKVSDTQPTAIAWHGRNQSVAFFAGEDNKLYRSGDGGATWPEAAGWNAVGLLIRELYVDASTAAGNETVYASTASGIYKSTDGGATWNSANTGLANTDITYMDGGMDGDVAVLYCVANSIVYKTSDGAANWTSVMTGLPAGPWYGSVATCETDPDVAYVGASESDEPTIYKTSDGGANWTLKLISPSSGRFPVTTTVERDWITISLGWDWGGDAHDIDVCATDSRVVGFAEDGRTWRSNDGGDTWFCCNNEETSVGSNWWRSVGFEVTNAYGYTIDPRDPTRHYIPYTDIGFSRSVDGGDSWRWAATGSPWRNTFYGIACDPTVAGRMWAVASNNHDLPHHKMLRQNVNNFVGGVLISNDWGATWTDLGHSTGLSTGAVTSVAIDPTSPDTGRTLWVTVLAKGVYKSTDGGATWVQKNTGLGMPSNMNAWQIVRMGDGTLYCALTVAVSGVLPGPFTYYKGGLFKSTDGGDNWTLINTTQDLPWIVGFSVDPTDANKIYVGCFEPDNTIPLGGGWRSTDGGATWERVIDTPFVWKITVDPEKPSRLLAGIQCYATLWAVPDYDGTGLMVSEDCGDTWDYMPTFPFTAYGPQQALFDPADSQNLYVTTFGGGVFKGVVPHDVAPTAVISATAGPGDLQVTFDSSGSTGDINTILWDFGDGQTSFAANPVHTYAGAGVYTVTLTVQGPAGTSTTTMDVTAADILSITTATLADGFVGSAYSDTVAATGGTAPLVWAVTVGALPDGLSLNASTGEISGTCTTAGTYDFTIGVTDSAVGTPQSASAPLEIVVNASGFTVTTVSLPGGQVGVAYSATLAASGGVLPYSWAVIAGALPDGLSLDPATGEIAGTATTAGTFNFTVEAIDSSAVPQTATRPLQIVIAPEALVITTASPMPSGQVGVAYSEALAATGGLVPYTWAVIAGALPDGLSLDGATGVIDGTPTVPATFDFTVEATDSQGVPYTDSKALQIVIAPATLVITTASPLPDGMVGVAYSQALVAAGGVAPYSWSITAGSLPVGLSLDGATGVISGTPTTVGASNFTAEVSDSQGVPATDSKAFDLTIAPSTLTITTASLPAGVEGQPYSSTLAAIGGVAPYTWFVARVDLPKGLTLNVTTGEISGSPFESGSFTVTFQVSDSVSFPATAQKALVMNIAAADSDGDGLADGWETKFFGNLSATATADPDGDGYINLAEFNNNTDPTHVETIPPYIAGARWTNLGLGGGGALYSPVIAPNDPGLMFANCDMGGFYRSTDGGRHFTMIDGAQVNMVTSYSPVACKPVFAPNDQTTIYVGRAGGVMKSTDTGITWAHVAGQYDIWSADWPTALAVDAADADYVLAGFNGYNLAAGQYLVESRDAGATWNVVAGWSAVGEGIREIYIDPTTPPASATMYLSTGVGMYKSTDGGANWSPVNTGLPDTDILDFAAAVKAGSAVLYCTVPGTLDGSNHLIGGPYRSTDGGATWQQIKNGLTEEQWGAAVYYGALGVCEGNADVVYLGSGENYGPTVYRTTDGGDNWEMVVTHPAWSAAMTPLTTVEPDWIDVYLDWGWGGEPHQIGVSPTNPNCVAFTEDGKAFRSDNGGYHWFPSYTEEVPGGSGWYQTRGLDVTNVYRYVIDPKYPLRHYLCNTDIGFSRSEDGGVTWKWASTGSPWTNTFYDLALDPDVDGKMWAAASNHHDAPHWKVIRQDVPNLSGGVVISADWGETWAEIGHAGGLPAGMVTSIALDPTSPAGARRMWVTVMGHGVYETNDGGTTWVARNSGLGTVDDMNCWMIRRLANGNLYCAVTMALDGSLVAHPGGLWKSVDGGLNWTQVNASQMIPWPVSFDIDPTDEDVIYIAGFMGSSGLNNGGIWKTTDGGGTWNLVFDKFDVWGVRIDPDRPNRVYAGAQGTGSMAGEGQFISEDAGATWVRMPGMPFTAYGAEWTFFDPADSQNIYMGTFGGGAWKSRILHADAPVAQFAAAPDSGGAPLDVTFDSSASTGTINAYLWDFDDGADSTAANPSHSYAADGLYNVTLTVYGPNGFSSVSHPVTVSTLSITTASLPDGTVGTAYSQTLTASGGIAPLAWSIIAGALPAGLSLDPATGVIDGTPTTAETANFTVEVQDSAAAVQTATQGLSIVVNSSGLTIDTMALPGGQVGVAYSTPLSASGGTAPYAWAIVAGALPPGLSLDPATGVIDGTPTTAGTANFTVEVTDSSAIPQTATRPLDITISAAALVITTASPMPSGMVGITYSQTLAASGGVLPYTWAIDSGALPAGLSLDPVRGVIDGVPTTAGTYDFTVRVTDSDAVPQSVTKALQIVIAASDLAVSTVSLPGGEIGTAYSAMLAATGGTPPYASWAITVGVLPPGLALDPATGEISGTPTTAEAYPFTVEVTDSSAIPQTATRGLSIDVTTAPLVITTASPLPGGVEGIPYSQALAATGGVTPYTWSIFSGMLPNGLTLNATTGVIGGTCTADGIFDFTVRVTDSQAPAATDQKAFQITVGTGTDTDGDGLPDPWEIANFGNLDQGAYDDPDDDGWYNITEYLRGQDPNVQDLYIPDLGTVQPHPRLWMRTDMSNPFVISTIALTSRITGGYAAEWNLVKTSTAVWNVALTYMFTADPVKLTTVRNALATTTTNADTLVERALAYDWVYHALTAAQRNTYAANLVTSGYNVRGGTGPAGRMYSSTGISGERAAAMAAMAAAGNDARAQDLFDRAYGAMMKFRAITGDGFDMADPAEHPGRAAFGGGWPEGYNFDRRASRAALQFNEALRSALEQDFVHNSTYWRDKTAYLIYGTTPDGGHLLPWDDNDTVYLHRFDREEMLMLAGDLQDVYTQYWLNHLNPTQVAYSGCVEFIFRDKALTETDFSALPQAHLFEGIGMGVLRSGWGTADTMTVFKASDWFASHQNNAAGSFMIYKTAPLTTRTGIFDGLLNDHYTNYVIRTVAQNALTVYRPGEQFFAMVGTSTANDGGQMVQQWSTDPMNVEDWRLQAARTGTAPNGLDYPIRDVVDSIDFDSTTGFAYMAAQFGQAYEAGKVPFASRQVLFVRPDWIIVFDRVTGGDPAYAKKFLLHSGETLTVNGDKAVINVTTLPGTTAPGKLFMTKLLPAGVPIATVGGTGFEYYYDGLNHPTTTAVYGDQVAGRWRLEETAPVEDTSYFLNVFYGATGGVADMPVTEIVSETANDVTLSINDGQMLVTFNKTGAIDYSVATGLPIQITTTSLPGATQDSPYAATILSAGGTPPFAWSVVAGNLPDGLSLNPSTGVISGTATVDGTFNFTVGVVDSAAVPTSDTQDLSIIVSATNAAPVITGVPDVSTNEDTPLAGAIDLWLYATDRETPASGLTYTITNVTNASAGVTVSGTRYVDVNPAANWFGSATVTVEVSDGFLTGTDAFVVTVNPVNDPPVIAGVPDVVTNEDTPVTHAVDLWLYATDPESASSALSYSIVSVSAPQAGVTVASNRYVNVSPAANWNGTATVVVQVSDGALTDTDTFDVTVNPVNDPPVIAGVPDVSTPEDTPLIHAIDLWAYTADPETPDNGLTYTILSSTNPNAGVSIAGNQYIDINPTAGWYGTSTVTVQASDGSLADTDVFVVAVTHTFAPPVIVHTPVAAAIEWSPVAITATITDADSSFTANLYYRKAGVGAYTVAPMANVGGDTYSATIPGSFVRPPSVQYYIMASDGASSPTAGPYTIAVTPLPDNTAPLVSGAATVPNRVVEGVDLSITLSAFADDSTAGNSNVAAAEWWLGADPGAGNGNAMAALDGAFDEVSEAVAGTINTSTWVEASSPYVVHVRARDDDGNWSAPVSVSVQVVGDVVPPSAITDLVVTVPPVSQYTLLPASVAEVSSEVAPAYAASMAVDGNPATYWSTLGQPASRQEYLTVDLGGHYEIGRITLYPGGMLSLFPAFFKVKVSDDDVLDASTTWTTVVTEFGYAAVPGANAWQIENINARYVRFEAEESMLDGGMGLYYVQLGEIEVSEVMDSSNALLLTWTAPGDDGHVGQASFYDIRYSKLVINAGNFNSATSVPDEPPPQPAGSIEGYELRDVQPLTRYFIAVKTADEDFNWSAISNVVTSMTGPRFVEGIVLLAPADETAMPVSNVPTFQWESSRYNRFWIELSNWPSFPSSATTLPDGTVIKTLTWSVGTNRFQWKPTASQWRSSKQMCNQTGGTLYWRIRGTSSVNPALGQLYSQTWHTYDIEGGHIRVASPVNGFAAPITPPPTFTWTYDGTDMTRFFVQFSITPDFQYTTKTLKQLPSGGVPGLSYTPTNADWKQVKLMAVDNGGLVYWRVKGQDASRSFELWSDSRTFQISGGTITLLPVVPNGDGTVPHSTPSPTFSWDYTGSGFYRFYVQFSVYPDFRGNTSGHLNTSGFMPGRGVTTTSVTFNNTAWRRVMDLDADVGETLYWRVKAVDADNAFNTITPPSSFTWQ